MVAEWKGCPPEALKKLGLWPPSQRCPLSADLWPL